MHDPLDPEMTILKQRIARRVKAEGLDPANMDLADITAVCERVISDVSGDGLRISLLPSCMWWFCEWIM